MGSKSLRWRLLFLAATISIIPVFGCSGEKESADSSWEARRLIDRAVDAMAELRSFHVSISSDKRSVEVDYALPESVHLLYESSDSRPPLWEAIRIGDSTYTRFCTQTQDCDPWTVGIAADVLVYHPEAFYIAISPIVALDLAKTTQIVDEDSSAGQTHVRGVVNSARVGIEAKIRQVAIESNVADLNTDCGLRALIDPTPSPAPCPSLNVDEFLSRSIKNEDLVALDQHPSTVDAWFDNETERILRVLVAFTAPPQVDEASSGAIDAIYSAFNEVAVEPP